MRQSLKKVPYGWIYLFLAPTLILYGMYTIWPVIATFWYSLLDWNGFQSSGTFTGLENYRELFSDSLFWNSISVTFLFLVIVVPIRFFVSLAIALLLNWSRFKFKSFFRVMIFIPVVTTSAIIGTIMNMFFDPSQGPVNIILMKLGLMKENIFLLGNADTALVTSGVIWCWKWLGISLIYWIASLQSIPEELYESAKIDGANAWKSFTKITAPLLVPFGVIILILTLSDALRVFDLMLTLTKGGPFFRTEVIEIFIYRWAFSSSIPRLGYASAAATVFGLFFIVLTVVQLSLNKIIRKGD
ncbi:carbohydrate ABC transporter permease [Breznakiella homolactica]|uniref:Sugar ABC transporter permease n=1 Tax=Breznakiella homolactica TaxID=2798577 RepID=A0A7T7XNI2_9SPIR|nr:sugar ABC transporter permease [Breznakiella homolactica]QQO09614.1 sugar ABC transporter permease [Breznakiella homolactica]